MAVAEKSKNRSPLPLVLATLAGTLMAAATVYLSYTRLRQPQSPLDWAALGFSGLSTGIILFMITWGHFQDDPQPSDVPPAEG